MKKNVDVPVCSNPVFDKEKIDKVKKGMPSLTEIESSSKIIKTIGDPTRLKILLALSKEELCVCDISGLMDVSVSAVSHQLKILRDQRLVKFRKSGKMVYYSLDDNHVLEIVNSALEHANERS